MAIRLAVAGDVFDDVLLGAAFSPRDVLNEIWNYIVSVFENFPTFTCTF